MPTLIDTHAHLDQLKDSDVALQEAHAAGVSGIVAVGIDHYSNQENLKLQSRIDTPDIYVALGVHPESLEVFDKDVVAESLQFIRDHCNKAVAIGEAGLDYWYKWARKDDEKKKQQRDVFGSQLKIAKEKNLPVVIHSRGAWKDCLVMAKDAGIKKAVFHWYSGPMDVLEDIISAGYFISVTPALYYSESLQNAVERVPKNQLLIETDTPVYYRYDDGGFSATPKDVFRTLQLYAERMNIGLAQAAEVFNGNAENFFGL